MKITIDITNEMIEKSLNEFNNSIDNEYGSMDIDEIQFISKMIIDWMDFQQQDNQHHLITDSMLKGFIKENIVWMLDQYEELQQQFEEEV